MKIIIYGLLFAFMMGCSQQPKKTAIQKDTIIQKAIGQSKILSDDNDTVNISTIPGDTLKYSKGELKKIKQEYPEFKAEWPAQPDITYFISESKDHKHDTDILDCEVCKDNYYALYAYFLKLRNGEEKYANKRRILIELYRDINEIFGRLNHGGTYFGHQYTRILGYAEYAVYLYKDKVKDDEIKQYPVLKQKVLYIASLKQRIIDEIDNDPELDQPAKLKWKRELFKTVSDIDGLITEYFYLERVQEFQYSNY